jgi:hypothetical protein
MSTTTKKTKKTVKPKFPSDKILLKDPSLRAMRDEGCIYIDPATRMDPYGGKIVPFIQAHLRNIRCKEPCVANSFYCPVHKKLDTLRKKGCPWENVDCKKCGQACTDKSLYCDDHEFFMPQP